MTEKTFQANGKMTRKGIQESFTKTVSALNEKTAKEKVYSIFGSNYGVKRRKIKIEKVEELKE